MAGPYGEVSEVELVRAMFDGKWRFDILRLLCEGPQRLSTFRRRLPRASKKVLIDALRSLEDLGWVERKDLSTILKRVEYTLVEPWAARICAAIQTLTAVDEGFQ